MQTLSAKIKFLKNGFSSPKGLLIRAAFISVIFLICEIAGLRQNTSFICGTFDAGGIAGFLSVFMGMFYVLIYLAFTFLVPVLIISSIILLVYYSIIIQDKN